MAPAGEKYGVSEELPSESELKSIAQIRESCRAELEKLTIKSDDIVGDLRICRFLRAKLGDTAAATEWYREFLCWRAEGTIEKDRLEVVGRSPQDFMDWFAKRCNPYLPMTPWVGRNSEGHVLFLIRPGQLHAPKFVEHRSYEMAKDERFMFQLLEWVLWYLNELSRKEGRMVYVVKLADFKGMGEGKPVPFFVAEFKAFMTQWLKVMQRFYCDHDSVFLLVNTNFLFRAVWAILKLVLTKRQTSKVRVLGDLNQASVRASLEAYLPESLIPEVYGGKLVKAPNTYPLATEAEIKTWYEQRHLLPVELAPNPEDQQPPDESAKELGSAVEPAQPPADQPMEDKPVEANQKEPVKVLEEDPVSPYSVATASTAAGPSSVEVQESVSGKSVCCVCGAS